MQLKVEKEHLCSALFIAGKEVWYRLPTMAQETLTFETDSEKRVALDRIARATRRDRSDVLNAAIEAYLAVHDWQIEHIEQGLREADAGDFAGSDEVARAFRR
jgi:predicted transcriptional regulator